MIAPYMDYLYHHGLLLSISDTIELECRAPCRSKHSLSDPVLKPVFRQSVNPARPATRWRSSPGIYSTRGRGAIG